MDAWGQLISKSTIETGDAWEHLLAQGGGSGTGTIDYVILADGMMAEMTNEIIVIEIESQDISVSVDNSFVGVGIDDQEILAEISNDGL